jgi:hypothetical protein
MDQCPRILEHAAATPEDGKIVAEIQLYRIALKLQHSQHRLQFAEAEYEEIERWKMEWAHLLSKTSLPPPIPALNHPNIQPPANNEDSTLDLNLWFCQLLLHRTATRLQPDSDRLTPEICGTARLIISKFLQTRFSTAPSLIDHVYFIVGYAALTLCDYNLTDPLISQVRGFLLHLAPSGDNLPYRIACIVGEVQRRYSEATAVVATAEHASLPSSSPVDAKGASLYGTGPAQHHSHSHSHSHSHPQGRSMDLSSLMPGAEVLDNLVEGYGCLDQLMPGYAAAQGGYEPPALFQHHSAPVTGGSLPIGLVPRALHDW